MSLVLADTAVWVAHFRRASPMLQSLLALDQVLCHPLIVLELACGTPPRPRGRTLGDLRKLQPTVVATTAGGTCISIAGREARHCTDVPLHVYGNNDHGAHAQYIKVAAMAVLLPGELSFTAGAAISCDTGTACCALRRLGVSGNDTVAINSRIRLATASISSWTRATSAAGISRHAMRASRALRASDCARRMRHATRRAQQLRPGQRSNSI